jgi:hypothetical protein
MAKFFLGEVVPNIWWVQILQENLYPNIFEYDFSWRSRTRVQLLQEKSTQSYPNFGVQSLLNMTSDGDEVNLSEMGQGWIFGLMP